MKTRLPPVLDALFACSVCAAAGVLSPSFDFLIDFNQSFQINNCCPAAT
jgi:hypothetical protein